MRTRNTVFLLLAGIAPTVALAQPPGVLNQVNGVEQRRQLEESAQQSLAPGDSAPELYPGEDRDVGPQTVLQIKPRRELFEATVDSQYFHTDNVLLQDHARYSTTVLVSMAQFAVAPTPYDLWGGQFAPSVGYSHQWFDYGLGDKVSTPYFHDVDTLDFNAQTMFADLRWLRAGWSIEAGFDYLRLMSTSDYRRFYEEAEPFVGASRLLPVCEHGALLLYYQGNYHAPNGTTYDIDPDFNERMDQGISASYMHTFCPRVSVQPYYQFKYTHFFTESDRNDYLNSMGIAVYYTICRACHIRAFFNYDIRRSDRTSLGPNYNELDAGGGVNVDVRF